ncbi:MIP family Ig-specific serine endopeptidase [Mycoplasma zalophi]|uniref:MIP family Ig-specific serine endopeptidase n=1 Tax=Mycoplasma zalophi TaxID=191287 RepID=UPI001C109E4C|nr:DUF31 family protein [Mycoplasma zalophi]MBU4690758.1 DUF31 family protein [Mycoplasma zalophi]
MMKYKKILPFLLTATIPAITAVSCSYNKNSDLNNKKDSDTNTTHKQNTNKNTEKNTQENKNDTPDTNSHQNNNSTNSNENNTGNENIVKDTKEENKKIETEDKKQEDNKNDQNFNPNFPSFSPDFFNNLNKSNHQYSHDVSAYQKLEAQDIYKEIYNRTFAIKFGVNLDENQDDSFLATSAGTSWLLDYHKENDNKYKLFFATNLHVAGLLSNTLDPKIAKNLNYEDERKYKANSISIGKTQTKISDFNAKENKYPYENNSDYTVKWIANNEYFNILHKSDEDATRTELIKEAISAPKLIFAGYDFIDRQYIDKFQDEAKQKAQEQLNRLQQEENASENLKDKSSSIWILKNTLDKKEYIPFYTDFAVFEIDVDFSKLENQEYINWFKDAITSLDNYIKRNKEAKTPNQDKAISSYTLTTDYVSAEKDASNNLTNSQNVYIGGYPAYESHFSTWSQNNPIERNGEEKWNSRAPKNKDAFGLPARSYEEKVTNNNFQPYTTVFGKTLADFYGFIHTINFSSLYYGASGSVVYNDFGQIIGIYSGVSSNVKYGDLSYSSSFTPLLLSQDYTLADNTIKAYNLIDGTNKDKYPAQIASYRQNLKKIYPQGFSDKKTNTAIFENGF